MNQRRRAATIFAALLLIASLLVATSGSDAPGALWLVLPAVALLAPAAVFLRRSVDSTAPRPRLVYIEPRSPRAPPQF